MPLNPAFVPVIECPVCGGLHKLTRPYTEIVRDCQDKLQTAKNRREIHGRRTNAQ
ncbi:MAG: hypothetical protein LLG16_03895 [Euryarchaeota archaeon]|nr:hypothetical protein [Euryarchaeota archaeon]